MDDAEQETRLRRLMALLRGSGRVNEGFVAPEVETVARAGHARAALLMATIAGCGFGCAQDWDVALGWLVRAAERGDAEARAHLALLAGAPADAECAALAAAIDIAAWVKPRAVAAHSAAPRIARSEGFLAPGVCAWLIAHAGPLQAQTRVYDYLSGRPRSDPGRTNSEASLTLLELNLPLLLIRQRIANTMGVAVDRLERTSIFRYGVGQRFAPHADYLDPTSTQLAEEIAIRGQRVITFLIYLNADFEGGETHFVALGERLRCGVGGALFFHNVDAEGAPDASTQHEGAPPTAGEKWLLSQFIRDKPQLPG